MSIVRLELNETERLRDIRLRALRDAPLAFGSTYEDVVARPGSTWAEQLAVLVTFVAVQAGRDVGMVRCCGHQTRSDAAELLSMWVAPEARGKGLGEALIDAVTDWACDRGFAIVILDVADDNAPAVDLYRRKGFAATGVKSTLPPPREHVLEHQRQRELSPGRNGRGLSPPRGSR